MALSGSSIFVSRPEPAIQCLTLDILCRSGLVVRYARPCEVTYPGETRHSCSSVRYRIPKTCNPMSHLGFLMAGQGPRSPYIWTWCVIALQEVFPLVRKSRWSHPVRGGVIQLPLGLMAEETRWLLLTPTVVWVAKSLPPLCSWKWRFLRQPNASPSSEGNRVYFSISVLTELTHKCYENIYMIYTW